METFVLNPHIAALVAAYRQAELEEAAELRCRLEEARARGQVVPRRLLSDKTARWGLGAWRLARGGSARAR